MLREKIDHDKYFRENIGQISLSRRIRSLLAIVTARICKLSVARFPSMLFHVYATDVFIIRKKCYERNIIVFLK